MKKRIYQLIMPALIGLIGQASGEPRTYLYVRGDPGEWVSRGKTVTYTQEDLDTNTQPWITYGDGTSDGIVDRLYLSLQFTNNYLLGGTDDEWIFWFTTSGIPTNLVVGDYPDAQRAAFAGPGHPGLTIAADGHEHNTLTGSFSIIHINVDYSGGGPELISLAAVFRQASLDEGSQGLWLRGSLYYNYDGLPRAPVITEFDLAAGTPILLVQNLMPGFEAIVQRADAIGSSWTSLSSFVCGEVSTNWNDSAGSSANRAFYRVQTR